MPFIEDPEIIDPLSPIGFNDNPIEPPKREKPAFGEVLGAGFRQENLINNGIRALTEDRDYGEYDPNYSPPFEEFVGGEFDGHIDRFIGAKNTKETEHIKTRIREEIEDRRTLEEAGVGGFLASMTAGVFDITTLLPLGGVVKGFKAGASVGKGALAVGTASAIDATISETGLHALQETRTLEESLFNVGGSFVLGGTIGAAVPAWRHMMTNREIRELSKSLEGEYKIPANSADDVFGEGGLSKALEAQSVGAAKVGTKENELRDTFGVAEKLSFQDPVLRAITSPFKSVRDAMTRLTEQSLEFKQNSDFIPTGPQGGSVEGRIKTQGTSRLYKSIVELDEAYKNYYFGQASKKKGAAIKSELNRRLFDDKRLTWTEFKQEVSKAMRRGDVHEIPEVQKAAQAIRRELFDPIKDDAMDVKLLPEGVTPDTAPSYLSRVYNKQKIVAQRGKFKELLIDYLEGGQSQVAKELERLEAENAVLKAEAEAAAKDQATFADFFEQRVDTEPRDGFQGAVSSKLVLDEYNKFAEMNGIPQISLDDLNNFMREQGIGFRAKGGEVKYKAFLKGDSLPDTPEFKTSNPNNLKFDNEDAKSIITGKISDQMPLNTVDDIQKRFISETGIGKVANDIDEAASLKLERETRLAELETRINELNAKYDALPPETKELAVLGREEISHIADDVIDTILGQPGGRTIYAVKKGPLHERTLKIADNFISKKGYAFEEFLENDVEMVMRYYTRTMVPDVEITREFGDLEMTSAITKIKDEAQELASKAPEDKRNAIHDAANRRIKDLQAVGDRLRGTYGIPEDPTAFFPRAGRTLKQLNLLRLLGGMTLSALPDVFRMMMIHGAGRQFDSMYRMIGNMKKVKLSFEEAKLAGTAADMVLDTRVAAMADIGEEFAKHTRFERAIDAATSQFGLVSLMAPWNAFMKQWAGLITQTRLLENVTALKAGKELTDKEIRALASAGIDEGTANRIASQFEKHGAVEDGVYLANTNAWDDRIARDAFRSAIVRDIDRIIITPGQDKPLFASTQVGSMIMQFKSFAIASVQRTMLTGLQQRDMATLMGLMASMGAGAMVEYLKALSNDKPLPKTNAQWAVAAFDRAGVSGYLFDVNHTIERLSRGNIGIGVMTGKRVSRFASRNWLDAFLGPTAGALNDYGKVIGASINGEFSESDFRALRRSIPFQNLFYYSWLLRRYEKDIQSAVGLEPSKGFND